MMIGAGLVEAGDDGRLYNTYWIATPIGETAKHRELHCFISPHMASGDDYTIADIPQGCRVGVLTCYDNNIIENVRGCGSNRSRWLSSRTGGRIRTGRSVA